MLLFPRIMLIYSQPGILTRHSRFILCDVIHFHSFGKISQASELHWSSLSPRPRKIWDIIIYINMWFLNRSIRSDLVPFLLKDLLPYNDKCESSVLLTDHVSKQAKAVSTPFYSLWEVLPAANAADLAKMKSPLIAICTATWQRVMCSSPGKLRNL